MKISVFDLAFMYIQANITKPLTKEGKKSIIKQFNYLLSKHWTSEDLIAQFGYIEQDTINIIEHYNQLTPIKKNLLKPSEFYYHNELRITSPPPVVYFDYNTGEFKKEIKDYFLEMRASYTLEDLYRYVESKDGLYVKEINEESKVTGILKWLLTKFNIDVLLFMIDIAVGEIVYNDHSPLTNIIDIQNYYLIAKQQYDLKRTECRIGGDDTIVPRKRMLSC